MRKFLILAYLLVFIGVAHGATAIDLRELSSITFFGYINKANGKENEFYIYTANPIKIELFWKNSYGIVVKTENNINDYKKILRKTQMIMIDKLQDLKGKPYVKLINKIIFKKYHVYVNLYRIKPYHYGSKLIVKSGNKEFTKTFNYSFITGVYPVKFANNKYMLISSVSCSAILCNSTLTPFRVPDRRSANPPALAGG